MLPLQLTPKEDTQHGVKHVEAVTLTWTKASLIAVFAKYDSSLLLAYKSNPVGI
jgi:hypothetical protein